MTSAIGGLCEAYMWKRSLNKRAFTKENYKNRLFVLYPTCLKYFDGSPEKGRGKVKGSIDLIDAKIVAIVQDGQLDNYDNAFQLVYEENGESYTLYVAAPTNQMRTYWIDRIKDACARLGVRLSRSYHPGVWSKRQGAYACCGMVLKTAGGCTNEADFNSVLTSQSRLSTAAVTTTGKLEVRVAMFDYNATEPGDLCLVKGEEYHILDSSRENWWLARNRRGQTGHVPSNYLRDVNSLEAYNWYFRDISRPRAEALLKQEGRDGTFLVRDSVQKPGTYTLSVFSFEGDFRSEGSVKHYHIKNTSSGSFFIAKTHVFSSIPDVIKYHKSNGAGLVTRLKNIPNQSAPIVALGSAKWEIDKDELQLLEDIGRGQFGSVKRGIWRGTTEVAVKMMKPDAMSEDDFIQEARTMTDLQHPNLVQLYGVITRKPIWIVVEFMAKGALQTYLKTQYRQLRTSMLVDMCAQVCNAMEYLESKNLIHRDLAARNCLIGRDNTVKVCDFGLARFVADDEYTSSSGTKFPVRWASPEVLHYSRFSSKSDVWAYGVLMWEIFSFGATPYGTKIRNQQIAMLLEQNKRLVRPDNCPVSIYQVMMSCWHNNPESRPNFQQLVSELEHITERDYQE